jgi:hypothetical protein
VASVADFETGILAPRQLDLDAIQDALERAGVEFINGDRPGVRLSGKGEMNDLRIARVRNGNWQQAKGAQ